MSEHRRERANAVLEKAGYAKDPRTHKKNSERMITSAVHQHESHDHPGTAKTKVRFADGGAVDGDSAAPRMDRMRRGGKTKGHGTKVNVIVAPQGGGKQPVPIPVPVGGAPGMPKPPMAPPPGAGPMPPPGMGAPPPGLPPGMPPMKKGGKVPHLEGGAGGGLGRLEKARFEAKQSGGKRKRGGNC